MSKYYTDFKAVDYVLDKELAIQSFIRYNLDRTQSMFEYKGLPDTIPEQMLEQMLQKNGSVFVTKVNGDLYAFVGGEGGEPDVYQRPTIYTVANPALNLSEDYVIDEDGILVANDTYKWGLIPMLSKYGALLVENEISLRSIIIYLRIVALISASDDKTKASADKFLEKVIAGDLSIVAEAPFFDGIKVQTLGNSTTSYIQQFIELEQYLKGSLYNELGLNANYNMKRESLTKNETALNEDFLMPLCDDMLNCRKIGCDKINAMFGTEISVEYSSTWKKRSTLDIIEMRGLMQEMGVVPESSQLDTELDQTATDTTAIEGAAEQVVEDAVEGLEETTVVDSVDDGVDDTTSSNTDQADGEPQDEPESSQLDGEQEQEDKERKEDDE